MRRSWALLAAALYALLPFTASAATPAWEQWKTVAGVFDLGGPRSDGAVLVTGAVGSFVAIAAAVLAALAVVLIASSRRRR